LTYLIIGVIFEVRFKGGSEEQFRYGGSRMRKATGRCSPQFKFLNSHAQGQAGTLSGLAKAEESCNRQ